MLRNFVRNICIGQLTDRIERLFKKVSSNFGGYDANFSIYRKRGGNNDKFMFIVYE